MPRRQPACGVCTGQHATSLPFFPAPQPVDRLRGPPRAGTGPPIRSGPHRRGGGSTDNSLRPRRSGTVPKIPDNPVTSRTNDPSNCLVNSCPWSAVLAHGRSFRSIRSASAEPDLLPIRVGLESPTYLLVASCESPPGAARAQAVSSLVSSSTTQRRTSSARTGRKPLASTASYVPGA